MRELMLSFADRHLSPYTLRGDELIPDFCPICHGGDNRDRYTFALNLTEGIYVCKRGSCGARGRFEELARRFGEQAEFIRPPGRMKKQYVLPEVMLKPLTDEEMATIATLERNNRLVKGQVFLWPGANDWHDLWDEEGVIVDCPDAK